MSMYIHTAVIQKVAFSTTAAGTSNPTYSTRIASLDCLVQGKQVQTSNSFGKETLVNVFKLYCDYNSTTLTIDESDRVVWQSRTFEITGIKSGGGQTHHLEINLLEVK